VNLDYTLFATDGDGRVLARLGDVDRVRPVASVGKLLLLGRVASAIAGGEIDPAEQLARSSTQSVADSGLWQHLDAPTLSVHDCCRLVAAVSDNLATNVLLTRVGLESVGAYAESLDVAPFAVLDLIRAVRDDLTPPTFARGSATSMVRFLQLLDAGEVPAQVRDWMRLNVDLGLAASTLALDPLAHTDATPLLHNKTGSDDGVRVDVGTIVLPGRTVHYCVMAHWPPGTPFTARMADNMAALLCGVL
jgi:beta-lactamase class A